MYIVQSYTKNFGWQNYSEWRKLKCARGDLRDGKKLNPNEQKWRILKEKEIIKIKRKIIK